MTRRPADLLFVALPVLALAAGAGADVIVTTEGQRHEGEVERVAEGWQITGSDGKKTIIPGPQIKSIAMDSGRGNGVRAMEGLQSLRRSVEHSADIARNIERYERFIEQSKDSAVIDEARKDLQIWIDRRDQRMVKVGRRWMTQDKQREYAAEMLERVEAVRQQIKAGQQREADAAVAQMLEEDPTNVSALYLAGVLRMKDLKNLEARKHFSLLQQSLPDHAPTQLNLSIILMGQRQWGPAASAMEQALAAAPGVQFLVDQAAELLNLLPEDQRKTPAAQRLARRFAEQDARLQQAMAERQMYRWGATWVDKATHDKLMAVEVEVKKKLQELQGDFDLTENRIARIDQEIAANERAMRDIERRSYVRTADGTLVRVPYPSAYYDMQREITRLNGERTEMAARLESLRAAARKVQADYPVAKYSGLLRTIEEDGVPVLMPADPAAAPATRAAPTDAIRPAPLPPATLPVQPQPAEPPIIRIGPGPGADEQAP